MDRLRRAELVQLEVGWLQPGGLTGLRERQHRRRLAQVGVEERQPIEERAQRLERRLARLTEQLVEQPGAVQLLERQVVHPARSAERLDALAEPLVP